MIMEELRIVFMGTPDFAVATLDTLLKNRANIVGVVTAPDKPAGRGKKTQQSAVMLYARAHGIKALQPTNLKGDSFLEELGNLNANLQIVVAFRMLPKTVWALPKYGTFNLHASLLPNYRGAAPINWAIINGETKTGVTTFFIDDKIDTGEMILQEATAISKEDSAGTLHDRLMGLGANLVLKTVHQIQNNTVKTEQQQGTTFLKVAPKINKDTCRINWGLPMEQIYDLIRGLSPYPTAWTIWRNGNETTLLKIYSTAIEPVDHGLGIGTVVSDKKNIKVAAKDGFISLVELQLPGKRRMHVQEMLNGIKVEKDSHMS